MPADDSRGPEEREPAGPTHSATEETLRRLEERLGRASEAAERLLAEAARSAGEKAAEVVDALTDPQPRADPPRDGPPPAGWQVPGGNRSGVEGELESLIEVVRSLRDLIPPELQRRLAEALRELLLALRALIDWYLERLDRNRTTPVDVQDIPIL
jgi:hypothetical protein